MSEPERKAYEVEIGTNLLTAVILVSLMTLMGTNCSQFKVKLGDPVVQK